MASRRIRRLHQNDGTPDCPICLDDILKHALTLSQDCSLLEVENIETARVRLSKGIKDLKALVIQFEQRMRFEVAPEVREYKRTLTNKRFPAHYKQNLIQYRNKGNEDKNEE